MELINEDNKRAGSIGFFYEFLAERSNPEVIEERPSGRTQRYRGIEEDNHRGNQKPLEGRISDNQASSLMCVFDGHESCALRVCGCGCHKGFSRIY